MHGATPLLLQLLVILGASRLAGLLFARLGQPQVVAEIATGMLLGPTFLGRVAPELQQALFPADALGGLDGLSKLGLVMFLFLVGLELDLDALRKLGGVAVGVTVGTIVVPMTLGSLLALALHPVFAADIPRVPFVFFFALCVSVTAFPVLARILAERGLQSTRVGVVSLGAAAAKDLIGFLLVGAATAIAGAGSPVETLAALGETALFVAVMVGVVRPLLARLERRYGALRDLGQTGMSALFLAALAGAAIAERIGLHALFGAFLFGVALPRVHLATEAIRERVEHLTTLVLLPTFFALTGLRTDLASAFGTQAGWTAAILTVATASMVVGAAIPARLGGFTWRDGVTLGVLANTRGLMELVILEIGRELGLLRPDLFAMLVVMALTNTLLTSPLVAVLYPRRRVLEETLGAARASSDWRLVACVADPGSAGALGRLAAALAARAPAVGGWALRLVGSSDRPGLFPAEGGEAEAPAEERLAAMAAEHGARLVPVAWPAEDRARGIVEFATFERANAVLLGVHRPLVGAAALGGPVARIASAAPCDVLVLHDRGLGALRRVVLALGGESDAAVRRIGARLGPDVERTVLEAEHAGDVAALVARAEGADLVVVGVGEAWGLSPNRFELQEPKVLAQIAGSVLVVAGKA